ncbi:MAG TPA: alpha/beta fold hydrolase [Gemmatimonadaceae bacterium]|nr:alpha/beta fold hydrolase [Gemmatimonadaceae bacterium]
MREVLFVQGGGSGAHDEWDLRLVESLRHELGPDYEIRYPRMPNEADPRFATWRPALARELAALADGAIVVGHSVGGTVLIQVLAERPALRGLGAIVLIAAPFIGDNGWPSEELHPPADLAERLPTGVPVFMYHGEDDDVVPVAHVELYARAIPHARVRRLAGRNHQLNDDLSEVARELRG